MVKAQHITRFGCGKALGGDAFVGGPLDGEDDIALPNGDSSQRQQGDHQHKREYQ